MAAVLALLMLVLGAVALAVILDKDAGELLPLTVFSIVLFLYFFYCANILTFGIPALFLAIAALILYAAHLTVKNKISIKSKITPAFVVFCCTAAFYFVYTAGNYSVNWDELRVWSAMPKAIYETKQLQLGPQALIFDTGDNMQTYPPALPLFANYFLAAAPSFAESYIFLAYSVFVSAITIQPFCGLHRKHWWVMPFAACFVLGAPFVLTLHGGDNSYFYQSLFIDTVLGFTAGYVFYLATAKPFASRFSRIRFALALSVLVIVKDSGIMFALLSLLCALCICRAEEKTPLRALLKKPLLPLFLMCLCYFIWKGLLRYWGISNHISFQVMIPTIATLGALPEALLRAPIINLVVFGFSFAVYALLLLAVCLALDILLKPYSKANCVYSFLLTALSFLFFAYGYVVIFRKTTYERILDLSYYRYFTTLTSAYLIFAVLRYFPAVFGALPTERKAVKVPVCVIGILACGFAVFALNHWESDYDQPFLASAAQEKPKILAQIPTDPTQPHKRVYLLMAEKEPNIFHHRFYFELIGSGINIENFYPDTDMYDGLTPSPYSVEETAEMWYRRLQEDAYDYIYVYSTNEAFSQAFAHLGLGEAVAGRAYPVTIAQ